MGKHLSRLLRESMIDQPISDWKTPAATRFVQLPSRLRTPIYRCFWRAGGDAVGPFGRFVPAAGHHRFDVVQDFVGAAAQIESMVALRVLIEDASRDLGFEYFAIVHHIRFGHRSSKVRLSNYPLEWLAMLRQDGRFEEPVLKAAERACTGFRWSRLHELTESQQR